MSNKQSKQDKKQGRTFRLAARIFIFVFLFAAVASLLKTPLYEAVSIVQVIPTGSSNEGRLINDLASIDEVANYASGIINDETLRSVAFKVGFLEQGVDCLQK